MLEPLRNPASWDNFRKVVVLVLILWAAVSAVLCIIYFFILGGRRRTPSTQDRDLQRLNAEEAARETTVEIQVAALARRLVAMRSAPDSAVVAACPHPGAALGRGWPYPPHHHVVSLLS